MDDLVGRRGHDRLRAWLTQQAEQLGSQLPKISWPFTDAYWAGEEKVPIADVGDDAWWPWEQKAYWLDGATRLAIVLKDEQLMAEVRESLDWTLEHAKEDGYLGPELFRDPKADFHRWPQNVFFRGLAALDDGKPLPGPAESADVAEAVRRHFLGDKADYSVPVRNVTNIEGMIWAYFHTGDRALLELAENVWKNFLAKSRDSGHGDLSELRVFADTAIDAHGCTYAETSKLPAILYMATGKPEYLDFARAAQRRIFDHHMLIDGIPSTSEYFRTTTAIDSHETCDIADHTWTWGYMLMATGEARWADNVERAVFNAAPGVLRKDWKALQYFSSPNQFLATLDSDQNMMEHGGRKMAFQPNPGERTACCAGDVHRIVPNYTIRMWMKTADHGLAAVLYGPSRVRTTAGAENVPVEIIQTTSYPFEETIRMTIRPERAVKFPLLLRAPVWCAQPRLKINGAAVEAKADARGFLRLEREFHAGDTVELTLPMQTRVSHWPQQGVGIEHGPIVYAMAIEGHWTSQVIEKYSTAEFPSWEARPAAAWNYGLALDAEHPEKQLSFQREEVGKNLASSPWTRPLSTISAPARKIESWELQKNPDNPKQMFTPPLPAETARERTGTPERIKLVPYGTTELRLTIFPTVKG
jgi:hypothetical protein